MLKPGQKPFHDVDVNGPVPKWLEGKDAAVAQLENGLMAFVLGHTVRRKPK
jgi:hypothetical protein